MKASGGVERRGLVLMMCLLCIGLGAQPAMAEAEQGKFDERVPLASSAADPCGTGELVLVEGTLHVWGHFTADAAGGFHNVVHVRTEDVTAIGETTGATYGYSQQELIVVQGHADGFPFVTTQLVTFRLTGPSGPFRVQLLAHLTINNNGEVTADQSETRVNCM